jgi:alkylated DNA repair protein alkB homolog 7
MKWKYEEQYVHTMHAPVHYDQTSAVVYPNVITEEEANIIIEEFQPLFKRRRYQKNHWDSVIVQYKEIELLLSEENHQHHHHHSKIVQEIIHRIQHDILFPNHMTTDDTTTTATNLFLPCHIIDLHSNGQLNAHVDSVRYSGHIVAGLSLQCHSIMRLRPSSSSTTSISFTNEENQSRQAQSSERRRPQQEVQQFQEASHQHDHVNQNNDYVDLLLPMNSLYVLSGMSRYDYTHELLSADESYHSPLMATQHDYRHMKFRDTNRISIIFRDTKQEI